MIRDDADVREDKDNEVRITFDLNQFKHSFRNGSEKPESEINSEFRNDLKDRILKVKAALFESQFNFTSE